MKQLLFIATLISVIACNQNKEVKAEAGNPALDSVQSAINAVLDYHTVASNNYDAKACTEMFTDDASVIEYGQEIKRMVGHNQIESSIALECEAFKKDTVKFDVKWNTNSLRVVNDMAYQDASVAFTINTPHNAPVNASAEAFMAWKKTGANQWKVHTLILYSH
jgi:ketosteroid isomerase-like protein